MHEIFIINRQTWVFHTDTGGSQVISDEFYSCYLDKELARKACIILKHEDEISGLYCTNYVISDDVIQTELPEQDPGMAMTLQEIEAKL